VTILTNFRTKQKQKKSQHTTLTQRRAHEKMREIKRVMFACSFFVMFVNVVLCVDALMLGVFDSIIYFSVLVLFYR
jgi:hypothetical protein